MTNRESDFPRLSARKTFACRHELFYVNRAVFTRRANDIRLRIISLGLRKSHRRRMYTVVREYSSLLNANAGVTWRRRATLDQLGVNNTDYASPRPLATVHGRRRSRYHRQRVIRVRSENPFSTGISSEASKKPVRK